MSSLAQQAYNEDFITIIAPTLAEVMGAFHAQGLAQKHYSIIHRTGCHSFTVIDGDEQAKSLFDGMPMTAATFVRRIPA